MPTIGENNMQITPNEIDTIEDAGVLDNAPVKLIRTKGGFWIAIGKPKGKAREEALAAGSHPAIVKYNIEKQFPEFQPAMMKSEAFSESIVVEKHSHFLPEQLRKSGHDIYSVQNGLNIEFQVTKQNIKVGSVTTTLENEAIVVKNMGIAKEFAKGIAAATVEKASSCGAKKIRIEGK